MKKTICVILTLLLTAGFISCGRGQESSESKMHSLVVRDQANKDAVVNLNEADEKTILGHINSATDWSDGLCDCSSDYTFEFYKGETLIKIYYSSSCGSLNDVTNQRSCELSDEAREEINRILARTSAESKDESSTEPKDESSNEPNKQPNEESEYSLVPFEPLYSKVTFSRKQGAAILGMTQADKGDAEYIANLLENGKWTNDIHKCITDYSVWVEDKVYEYSSECGCFIDRENEKTLDIGGDTRTHTHLNAIFGVSDEKHSLSVSRYNETIRLTKSDAKTILGYINSVTDWSDGLCDCYSDYTFEFYKGETLIKIYYSSSCGSLNDITNKCRSELSDEVREEINRILESTPNDLDE